MGKKPWVDSARAESDLSLLEVEVGGMALTLCFNQAYPVFWYGDRWKIIEKIFGFKKGRYITNIIGYGRSYLKIYR